jgi:hypothetical protein
VFGGGMYGASWRKCVVCIMIILAGKEMWGEEMREYYVEGGRLWVS